MIMKQPDLGRKISQLRKEKGLTQDELVSECNINVRTLQRIESGEVMPRLYTIRLIFEVLGCDVNLINEELNKNASQKLYIAFKGWLNHGCRQLQLLFNLKVNTMKKVSVLSVFVVATFVFIIGSGMGNKKGGLNLSDKLVGEWKLVSSWNNGKVHDVLIPRYLKLSDDNSFISSTIEGNIYNSGHYYGTTDSTFITIHDGPNGKPMNISNLYSCRISKDTLRFQGFYIKQISGANCRKSYVNETWVRVKKMPKRK